MRTRHVKPGLWKNEALAELGPCAQLLFAGLWVLADREGRLEDRPKRIKAELFPYYDCDVDALLDALAAIKDDDGLPAFVLRYTAQGRRYLQVWNFRVHQRPHANEQASVIPPPPLPIPEGDGDDAPRHEESTTKGVPTHNQGSANDALELGPELGPGPTPKGVGSSAALALRPASPPSRRKSQPRQEMDDLASPPSAHPAVQVYRTIFHRHPDAVQREAMIGEVGEAGDSLAAWEATCKAWRLANHNPGNLAGLLDRFHKQSAPAKRRDQAPRGVPDNIRHIREWEARHSAAAVN